MGERSSATCHVSVMQWNEAGWQTTQARLDELYTESPREAPRIISQDTKVFIIIAHTPEGRESDEFRREFTESFCMPELWHSPHLNNANGYFGCEATRDAGVVTGFNTWSFFEMKHVPEVLDDYHWSKINVSTRWLPKTNQMGVFLLDPTKDLSKPLLNPDPRKLNDPFWVYSDVLQEVASLQGKAVWKIRNHVRAIENKAEEEAKKEKENKSFERPRPDYRQLHNIARHAIHVTESLDVAVQNVEHIIRQHEMYMNTRRDKYASKSSQNTSFEDISSRLSFYQSHIESIRHRSISNQKRLENEIQLKFNQVAQYDAGVTVDISRAAREDSANMNSIAIVTLLFLPPTFLAAIFSMSFFNYDRDLGWSVSDKFWIYWVFTVPLTAVSFLFWYYWGRILSPKIDVPPVYEEKIPQGLPMYA
ncbi:hypothetical protein N7490_007533 [Penicillium lividum]|nr:hypothetical protein N7490_007533 [Penicillium lividum]